jgi:hypothetical protein
MGADLDLVISLTNRAARAYLLVHVRGLRRSEAAEQLGISLQAFRRLEHDGAAAVAKLKALATACGGEAHMVDQFLEIRIFGSRAKGPDLYKVLTGQK